MAALSIFLFGNLELYRGEILLSNPPTRKSQSLLAYLVTHRSQPHGREKLAGLF